MKKAGCSSSSNTLGDCTRHQNPRSTAVVTTRSYTPKQRYNKEGTGANFTNEVTRRVILRTARKEQGARLHFQNWKKTLIF